LGISGQEFIVEDVGNGILLKPKIPFEEKNIKDVASSLEENPNH